MSQQPGVARIWRGCTTAEKADAYEHVVGLEPLESNRIVVKDSTAVLKDYPHAYRPGSEDLDLEEMRITALGTAYPARRGQAAAGFMCELGNGDVFIF